MTQTTWTITDYCPECSLRTKHTLVKDRKFGDLIINNRSCNVCGCKRRLYTPRDYFKQIVAAVTACILIAIMVCSCTSIKQEIPHNSSQYNYYMNLPHSTTTDTIYIPNPFPGDKSGSPEESDGK